VHNNSGLQLLFHNILLHVIDQQQTLGTPDGSFDG
jgi:hypothetical protein